MSLEQWNRPKERRTSNLTLFKVESIDFQTVHLRLETCIVLAMMSNARTFMREHSILDPDTIFKNIFNYES